MPLRAHRHGLGAGTMAGAGVTAAGAGVTAAGVTAAGRLTVRKSSFLYFFIAFEVIVIIEIVNA